MPKRRSKVDARQLDERRARIRLSAPAPVGLREALLRAPVTICHTRSRA
jgi:hypothetical protein